MEKHTVRNICRWGVTLAVVALTAATAHANLLQNAGFELSNDGTTAANWNEFGNAAQSGTNNTTVTVRNGIFSMQTGSTATNVLAGSGAYQDVPVGLGSGPNWRVTGFLLTWINALITGPDSYGVAQLVFLDSGSNVLQTTESLHYGTDANLPVNTWVPFEVDATAPAGTATVRVYVMTVGDSLDTGNIYFDDLNLYTTTGSLTTSTVTNQAAVQVSWPTSSRTNRIDYQVQSTKSLVFSNAPIISVLTNGSFESAALAPWQNFVGTFISKAVARSGTQSVVQAEGGTTVAVLGQTVGPASPGQVWDLQGYGYSSSSNGITSAGGRAVIKFAWLNASNAFITPIGGSDTNQIGTDDSPPNAGIVATPQMTSASPQNLWTFMEARGTAPAGTASIQVFCLLIPNHPAVSDTIYFDDLTLALVTTNTPSQGYSTIGPVWIGNSHTNQIFDTIGASTNKFYRITTP
jgi:hypothetical protein